MTGAAFVLLVHLVARVAPAHADPLTLAEALAAARADNLTVLGAATTVAGAEADRAAARADLLPSVSAAADLGYGNSAFSPVPGAEASAVVTGAVPLLDLPALARARAARAQADAAEARLDAVVQATLADVARRYVALQQAREQVVAAEARRQRAERLRALAADRVELGAAPRIDLTRAELALRTEEARLLSARTGAATAEVALAESLGAPVDQTWPLVDAAPLLAPESLPTEAALVEQFAALRERDPEVVAALRQLDAAAASRRAQAAAAAPILSGYGQAGVVTDLIESSTTPVAAVGVSASIPIWAGGARAAEVAGARADEEARRLAWVEATRRLEAELRVALRVVRDAGTGIGVAEASLALAREELERAESRYREGAEGNLVVVTAQAELALAEQARVDAVAAYNRAVIGWLQATGRMSDLAGPAR